MNKRQKKKLYKKLHGHNPTKISEVKKKEQPKPLNLSRLEPPYIKTAKILTAQRAAGKRRKRNYSKRRK